MFLINNLKVNLEVQIFFWNYKSIYKKCFTILVYLLFYLQISLLFNLGSLHLRLVKLNKAWNIHPKLFPLDHKLKKRIETKNSTV